MESKKMLIIDWNKRKNPGDGKKDETLLINYEEQKYNPTHIDDIIIKEKGRKLYIEKDYF